jgi:hypothetical protein
VGEAGGDELVDEGERDPSMGGTGRVMVTVKVDVEVAESEAAGDIAEGIRVVNVMVF